MSSRSLKYDEAQMGVLRLDLPPEQEQALHEFNRLIIQSNAGDRMLSTCLSSRLGALADYCDGQRSVLSLSRVFKKLYPHWGPYNSVTPVKNIKFIFSKMFSSGWIPYGEAVQYKVSTAPRQSKDNLFIPQNPSMILKRRCCIIHPDRRVDHRPLGLCGSCANKARRLGILHLITFPLPEIILHILATRIKSPGRGNVKPRCVNHPEKKVFEGDFCAECIINQNKYLGDCDISK